MLCPHCHIELVQRTPLCPRCQCRFDTPMFYVQKHGQTSGPFAFAQIMDWAQTGHLTGNDSIAIHGQQQWQTLFDLRVLVPSNQGPGVYQPQQASPPLPKTTDISSEKSMGFLAKLQFHVRRAFASNLREATILTEEKQSLEAKGLTVKESHQFMTWRRSVLWAVTFPLGLSATLASLGLILNGAKGLNWLGLLLQVFRVLSLFAMPFAALVAASNWQTQKLSQRAVFWGFLIAFGAPLAIALVPTHWCIDFAGDGAVLRAQQHFVQFIAGIATFITLMPAALSLIPGVLRACLRIKVLMPQSMLPGFFLVAAAPIYFLFFLITFVMLLQMSSSILLVLSTLAMSGAPLVFLLHTSLFTKPLSNDEQIKKLRGVTNLSSYISLGGAVLLLIYALTGEIFGKTLLGFDDSALMRPWDVKFIQFPIEYLSRSLFNTVVVTDLFMVMNLSLWADTKNFHGTPEAAVYDNMMNDFRKAAE